jgi:hypothetical protein
MSVKILKKIKSWFSASESSVITVSKGMIICPIKDVDAVRRHLNSRNVKIINPKEGGTDA